MLSRRLGDRATRDARGAVAQGRRRAASRSAARRSASSATGTSDGRWASSPRCSGCASSSSTSSRSCRWATTARRRRSTSCSAQSDFVTLHVPETPQTRGMMGARELAAMKAGALPPQRQPRHRGRHPGARRGAEERAPRGRRDRRLPRGAGDEQRRLQVAAPGPAERHHDAAHRRVDGRGAGGHRPRGRARRS